MSNERETVYDAEVAPLMEQIVDICKRNDIPMVASFELDMDGATPRYCSTAMMSDVCKVRGLLLQRMNREQLRHGAA